ncbi:hypothetical protein BJX61DRAFT_341866 [Aspergillus egyptiacus]|nr:hypothetical protein BJX61DRAFT_341866 [Aspergillus egyptiacus]
MSKSFPRAKSFFSWDSIGDCNPFSRINDISCLLCLSEMRFYLAHTRKPCRSFGERHIFHFISRSECCTSLTSEVDRGCRVQQVAESNLTWKLAKYLSWWGAGRWTSSSKFAENHLPGPQPFSSHTAIHSVHCSVSVSKLHCDLERFSSWRFPLFSPGEGSPLGSLPGYPSILQSPDSTLPRKQRPIGIFSIHSKPFLRTTPKDTAE